MCALGAVVHRGDEVVTFEPYYEQYAPMVRSLGARLRTVRLEGPVWELDPRLLANAFNQRTAALILNDPHNPTGKVFALQELQVLSGYCQLFDVVCIADEVYEHFTFDGRRHVSMIELEGMRERTVLISSLSKTYQAPGWRIGFAIAGGKLSSAIRERHELFSGGAPTPLQAAAVSAFRMPQSFYGQLRRDYQRRRDYLEAALSSLGFLHSTPSGGFYIFTELSGVGVKDSQDFVFRMMDQAGVAAVPGGCFYSDSNEGRSHVRFCFAKAEATLKAASQALSGWLGRDSALIAAPSYHDSTNQLVKEDTL
jgi:aminotransferase